MMTYVTRILLALILSILSPALKAQAEWEQAGVEWVTSGFDLENANTPIISSEARFFATYKASEKLRLKAHLGSVAENPISSILIEIFTFGNSGDVSGTSYGVEAQYQMGQFSRFTTYATSGLSQYRVQYDQNSQRTIDTQTRLSLGLKFDGALSETMTFSTFFGREFEIGGSDSSELISLGIGFNL